GRKGTEPHCRGSISRFSCVSRCTGASTDGEGEEARMKGNKRSGTFLHFNQFHRRPSKGRKSDLVPP
ncbi:unnamed protein product, partial [Musa acuminata subsp. burmannicoides]